MSSQIVSMLEQTMKADVVVDDIKDRALAHWRRERVAGREAPSDEEIEALSEEMKMRRAKSLHLY